MSTPVYDALLGEVLASAHAPRDRLAAVHDGLRALHVESRGRCSVCREDFPCTTRRLADGLATGEMDIAQARRLVALATAPAPAPAPEPPPARPAPRMPGFADLLDAGRTGRALDVLLGRRH